MYAYSAKQRNFIDVITRKPLASRFLDQYKLGETVTQHLDERLGMVDRETLNPYLYVAYYQLLYKSCAYDFILPQLMLEKLFFVRNL